MNGPFYKGATEAHGGEAACPEGSLKVQFLSPKPATPHGPLGRGLIIPIRVCLWKSRRVPTSTLQPQARGPGAPHPRPPRDTPPHSPGGVSAFTGILPQAATDKAVNPCPSGLATQLDVPPTPTPWNYLGSL